MELDLKSDDHCTHCKGIGLFLGGTDLLPQLCSCVRSLKQRQLACDHEFRQYHGPHAKHSTMGVLYQACHKCHIRK